MNLKPRDTVVSYTACYHGHTEGGEGVGPVHVGRREGSDHQNLADRRERGHGTGRRQPETHGRDHARKSGSST